MSMNLLKIKAKNVLGHGFAPIIANYLFDKGITNSKGEKYSNGSIYQFINNRSNDEINLAITELIIQTVADRKAAEKKLEKI